MRLEVKAMRVEGAEIPKGIIGKLVRRMKGKNSFRASDITDIALAQLEEAKIQSKAERPYIAHRLADRMIQKARKAGVISLGTTDGERRSWRWVS